MTGLGRQRTKKAIKKGLSQKERLRRRTIEFNKDYLELVRYENETKRRKQDKEDDKEGR
jgi:hypothetical protein